MDIIPNLQVWWSFLLLFSLKIHLGAFAQNFLQITFTKSPANVTNQTSAAFEFTLKGDNGQDPCGACSIKCKLDSAPFQDCLSRGDSYVNLVDGKHSFVVSVSTSNGKVFTTEYQWTVDTVPPTAAIYAGPHFTSAFNVTVDIRFSEPCMAGGGFICHNLSSCDLFLYGPGVIIPSSLKVVIPELEYNLVVELSNAATSGRILLVLAKGFCTDAAGNLFQRSANSSFVIHLDRTTVFVNLWTAIPETEVTVNHRARTLQATNRLDDLLVYLDFTEPVLNSTEELLSSLEVNMGDLVPIERKSHGNRRFGFQLVNVSRMAVVTVGVKANTIVSRAGTTIAPTNQVAFVFDNVRPMVMLTTTLRAKIKDNFVPILVQFSEPVFAFDSSDIVFSGGNISSFKEVSKSSYFVELLIESDTSILVFVPENRTFDVAGNPNFASNILKFNRYSVPASSITLYSFTTAGLLATTLASGALSVSSASLAAAGALESQRRSSLTTNPSRNLLGMASHLQVFALSSWLAVSLPVEYFETVKGLRWLVPHVKLPWEKKHISSESDFVLDSKSPRSLELKETKRRLLTKSTRSNSYMSLNHHANGMRFKFTWYGIWKIQQPLDQILKHQGRRMSSAIPVALPPYKKCPRTSSDADGICMESGRFSRKSIKERKLGLNASLFGPPLSASEYFQYFENQTSNLKQSLGDFSRKKNTGWKDFERNMFWSVVVGGFLIIAHILLLSFLRWRMKTSLRGSLSIPRFELFLLLLAISSLCQASSFIIKGGTTEGIIIGVLLLAIPTAFLFSVLVFILVAIIMGALVQYKEIKQGRQGSSWHNKLVATLLGKQSVGKWVRKEGLTAAFLPRFGLLFEDRKGPTKLLDLDGQVTRWVNNRSNGIGRTRSANSDDSEDASVAKPCKLLGITRVFYIIVDIVRRITIGVAFGAYPSSDSSWSQVSIVFGISAFQLLYLIFCKPYIRRGVQIAETVSLICEVGIFAAAIALLLRGEPFEDHKVVGIVMLTFLMVNFVVQLVNEWYALMEQLLRLSPSQDPSFKLSLKMFWQGLMLPFIPRRKWSNFITPQIQLPKPGVVPAVTLSPSPDFQKTRIQPSNSPAATMGQTTVSVYDPGSPSLVDPRFAALNEKGGSEISPAAIKHSGKQARSQWSRTRSLEGKKSKAARSDPSTSELKLLRELAKASFPGIKRDVPPSDLGSSFENIPPFSSPSTGGGNRGKGRMITPASGQLQSSEHSSDDSEGEIKADVPRAQKATTGV